MLFFAPVGSIVLSTGGQCGSSGDLQRMEIDGRKRDFEKNLVYWSLPPELLHRFSCISDFFPRSLYCLPLFLVVKAHPTVSYSSN